MMSSTFLEAEGSFLEDDCTYSMLQCALHAEVTGTVKGFCKISEYNIFDLHRYTDMNIKKVVKTYYTNI